MSLILARSGCALGVLLAAIASPAAAQPWPAKSIRLVVPYTPGAGADLHARVLAQKLTESLGQTVLVDNRAIRP
jgi:tripartite-type tricarboxylate transporter receptor subunit TctC